MAGNSESNKRAVITRKERHGADFYKRITSMGGRVRTRGYFGYLKDTNPEALKALSKSAAQKSVEAKRLAKTETESKTKGRSAKRNSASVPGGR